MAKDLYEILGVSRAASADEIKKTYRTLAKKFHPDVNKGEKKAEDRFKEISQAYDILGDPEKKKKYDQFGQWGEGGFDPRHQAYRTHTWAGGPGGAGGTPDFDIGDLFGDLFGMGKRGGAGGARGGRPQRGAPFGFEEEAASSQDLHTTVDVSFEEAIAGTTRRVVISRNGRQEKIDVKVPVGIKDGGKIRLTGKGDRGGDVYIKVNVAAHAQFWREDDDIYIEVPITITEAVLGTKIRVVTLDGAVNLKIPPSTSSGQKFRIPEKGVPHTGKSGKGDQFVKVKIVVPPHLDEESKALFQKIHDKISYDPRQ